MNLDFQFFSGFLREKRNDLFTEDLLYPIKYTGPEKDEKKVKDKIIAGVLKCDKHSGIQKDKEFGEIAVFKDKTEKESVTYVVSRKPFYNINSNSESVVCLKKKCIDNSFENTVKLFFKKYASSTVLQKLFSSDTNYIEYIQKNDIANTEEFLVLYRFLNELEEYKNKEDDIPIEIIVKNVCHRLYVFFRDSSNGKTMKNFLENILVDEDYRSFF